MARPLTVGDELPVMSKVIYQRALAQRKFSDDSIHNDDHTRRHGYPGALVSAYVLAGYMSEPMVRFFGASWFTTGNLSLTFIGSGTQQGDAVTIHAAVSSVDSVDELADGHRISFDMRMEKGGGSVAVVGKASAILAGEA